MDNFAFKNDLGLLSLPRYIKWRIANRKREQTYIHCFGTAVFCGPQGSGKTLSSVQYVEKVFEMFPKAVLVTNVELKTYPVNAYMADNGDIRYIKNNRYCGKDYINLYYRDKDFVKPVLAYTGLDMLTSLKNGKYGVIYLIDEFHLELNSLESKNIPIEVMTEISQQRKQRIHIVGTSQVFMRLAKPLREQIFNVILCKCYFGALQVNKMALGEDIEEKDGELKAKVRARSIWFHKPEYYEEYDTYAKMKRYTKLWKNSKGGMNSIYEQ